LLPLIDQAITGMSNNTWDVKVEDMSAKDLALFRDNYPALRPVTVETTLLPPFDRAAAQRWWDGEKKE
jgi:hypothetical protein